MTILRLEEKCVSCDAFKDCSTAQIAAVQLKQLNLEWIEIISGRKQLCVSSKANSHALFL